MSDAFAAKREELRRKKEHWFAQRLAAQEREKLENEVDVLSLSLTQAPQSLETNTNPTIHQPSVPDVVLGPADPKPQPKQSKGMLGPSDEQVLDRITERITTRLREEVRSEVMLLVLNRILGNIDLAKYIDV